MCGQSWSPRVACWEDWTPGYVNTDVLALVPVCTSDKEAGTWVLPWAVSPPLCAVGSQHYHSVLEFSVVCLSLYGKTFWFLSVLYSWLLAKCLAYTLSQCLLNCGIKFILNLLLIASGDGHWESDWPESRAWKGGSPCTPQTPEPSGPRNGFQAAPTWQTQSGQVKKPLELGSQFFSVPG